MWKVRRGPREMLGYFEEADLRQKIQLGEVPWHAEAMRPGKRRYEPLSMVPEFADLIEQAKVDEQVREEAARQRREAEWQAAMAQIAQQEAEHRQRLAQSEAEYNAGLAEKEARKRGSNILWGTFLSLFVVIGSAFLWVVADWWDGLGRDYQQQQRQHQERTAQQAVSEAQKEQEQLEQRRQAREMVRQGRLQELRGKPTTALAKEITVLLGKEERKDFCATYPYLTVLQERDKDGLAKSLVTTIRAREKKEMDKDRDGVTKKFCLCSDGEVMPVRVGGKANGTCCSYTTHGPRIADVPPPTDRADCRGLDNVILP